MKVWLADLTHTQQTIASDVVPAAIGMIAEFAAASLPEISELRLFKFPEALSAAFDHDAPPDVIGFSTYVWNCSLSRQFARVIKERFPSIVTVVGGPSVPTSEVEQRPLFESTPFVDYYVVKEGEAPFASLLRALAAHDFHRDAMPRDLPGVAWLTPDGDLVHQVAVERVADLGVVPSPYLSGRLDEFLDGRLMPIIQAARGCPFTCTFCTEGQRYWTNTYRKPFDVVAAELRYIATHMAALPATGRRDDLCIADSNFGMFEPDVELCRVIGGLQREFGYPRYINVATGKNKKERVLEAAKLVGGAMKLLGSVQSLDEEVLTNIKRKNISADQIVQLALDSAKIDANSWGEVILGLPGDSVRAHFETLRQLVDAGFNTISMYSLQMLPATELSSEESRDEYEMVCKFRVVPRCYGVYDLLGQQISVAEIEEICVQNKTLPFEDYLLCRAMDFIVNVFFNDGVFAELLRFLDLAGVSRWEWLSEIYGGEKVAGFEELLGLFASETRSELWDNRADLVESTRNPAIIREKYLTGEIGSNLIFKYKGLSLTKYLRATCATALRATRACIDRRAGSESLIAFAEDIVAYKYLQMEDLFSADPRPRTGSFNYDVERLTAIPRDERLEHYKLPAQRSIRFSHTAEQLDTIANAVRLFGSDTVGLSRILSRVFLKRLFRQPAALQPPASVSSRALEQPTLKN